MDPATAKTLVSAALVAAIALFSVVSFRAFLAQVLADLRDAGTGRTDAAARAVPVRAERPRRRIG